MRAVDFKTLLNTGQTVTVTGYPTTTPGLVVHESLDGCSGHALAPCWTVTHTRSGMRFPWCFESPEAALEFAGTAGALGSWHLTGGEVRRRVMLPYVRRYLGDRARRLHAFLPGGASGDPDSIDNGVIA